MLSLEDAPSRLLFLVCKVGLQGMLGEWFTICRIRCIISPMPLSRETSLSSIDGIAVASDQVDALSWKRSVVSGSSHSSLFYDT